MVSVRSLIFVEVPWAFMYPISLGSMPASSMAWRKAIAPKFFRIGGGLVVGVAGAGVADHFAEDLGAAGLRVLQRFEDENAGALADDEAVALGVEGTRGLGRVIVAGRQGLDAVEARDAQIADWCFTATCDGGIAAT